MFEKRVNSKREVLNEKLQYHNISQTVLQYLGFLLLPYNGTAMREKEKPAAHAETLSTLPSRPSSASYLL